LQKSETKQKYEGRGSRRPCRVTIFAQLERRNWYACGVLCDRTLVRLSFSLRLASLRGAREISANNGASEFSNVQPFQLKTDAPVRKVKQVSVVGGSVLPQRFVEHLLCGFEAVWIEGWHG